ncbi:isochorismatase family cysteine hydrolase [Streptomyces variegatus]|uniref:isochorismatase family cysteine hydrolase n=1 Tax=Streptomyces variegatus TaxID=284040 RepID=UPI003C2E6B46
MTAYDYDLTRTGILLVDPLNDFLSDDGKLWPLISEVAQEVELRAHLSDLVSTAREADVPVFYVPHHRWVPGSYESWAHPNPSQRAAGKHQLFAQDAFGGDWYPPLRPQPQDIVVSQHWAQSGFANTDLEMQLRQRGVDHVIVVGLLANTCIESTARFAMELGFHVSLVTDATAAYTHELMRAAHELNGPTYAHVITDTKSAVAALRA